MTWRSPREIAGALRGWFRGARTGTACTLVLIGLAGWVQLSLFRPGQSHPLELSVNDYDQWALHQSIENYRAFGVDKHWGLPNRKGLLRIGYYEPLSSDGCVLVSDSQPAPQLYNLAGEQRPAPAISNDCIYAHYPPLAELSWFALARLGVSVEPSAWGHVLAAFAIQALFVSALFALLSRWVGSWAALAAMAVLVLSKGYFLAASDTLYRPLENLFFVASLLFFVRDQPRRFVVATLLSVLSGYEYALVLPLLGVAFFARRAGAVSWRAVARGTLPMLAAHSLLLVQKSLALGGAAALWRDVAVVVQTRTAGEGAYLHTLGLYLRAYFAAVDELVLALPIAGAILGLVVVALLGDRAKLMRVSGGLTLALLASVNLALVAPFTAYWHWWIKFWSSFLWVAPLVAYGFAAVPTLWRNGRKRTALIATALALAVVWRWGGPYVVSLGRFVAAGRAAANSPAPVTDLSHIEDISLASTRPLDWEQHDLRRILLLPSAPPAAPLEYPIAWLKPIAKPVWNQRLILQVMVRDVMTLTRLRFVFTKPFEEFACRFYALSPPLYQEAALTPATTRVLRFEPTAAASPGVIQEHVFADLPVSGVLVAECEARAAQLARLWFN